MSNIPPHMSFTYKRKSFYNEPQPIRNEKHIRKQTVLGILENDPELVQEIIVELRKKKIKQIKKTK